MREERVVRKVAPIRLLGFKKVKYQGELWYLHRTKGGSSMTDFSFGFESFHVENCRSKGDHNDSDWLTVHVLNGDRPEMRQTKQVGANLHAGDSADQVFVGPFDIDESKFTSVTFSVTNLRQTDDQEQAQEAEKVAAQVGAAVLAILGGVEVTAGDLAGVKIAEVEGAIIGAIGTALSTFFQTVGIDFSDPFCNGEVLTHPFLFPAGQLTAQSMGPILETAKSPSECGNDPHTTVTYGFRFFKHNIPPVFNP
jgi:hypothetical protein